MAQANPGMTAGTYYLKGKKTHENINGYFQCMSEYDDGNGRCIDPEHAEHNANKATLLSAYGSSYCSGDYIFECSVSGLYAFTSEEGDVGTDLIVDSYDDFNDDIPDCAVLSDGSSICSIY
jgi:hypothetical protein